MKIDIIEMFFGLLVLYVMISLCAYSRAHPYKTTSQVLAEADRAIFWEWER